MARATAETVFVDGRHAGEADLRALATLTDVRTLQISGLRYTLDALESVKWIESLHLNDPSTLEGLETLQHVQHLTVYHLPKIRDLSPIGALATLKTLLLSTPPSYDSSRRCFEVSSLKPLGHLTALDRLTMRGIVPLEGGLEPLHALTQLRRLNVTHVYVFTLEDYARLARALPDTTGHCLQPFFPASWAGTCSRCGEARVVLTGPRPRRPRLLCPLCNRARLDDHIAAWRAVREL